MSNIIPHPEWHEYHLRNKVAGTLSVQQKHEKMAARESKSTLWDSVSALMRYRYGAENINRLAREAGIGPASVQRLKAQETSVGLDVVDKVAHAFKLPAWQLLVPGFKPDALPDLTNASPMAKDIAAMLDAIEDDAHRRRAYALVVQTLQFGAYPALEKAPEPAAAPTPAPAAGK